MDPFREIIGDELEHSVEVLDYWQYKYLLFSRYFETQFNVIVPIRISFSSSFFKNKEVSYYL